MNSGWSTFIIAIVALNIAGCAWLLWWTARRRGGDDAQAAPQTTGHVWDGDLTEYNKPLPRWWINLFWLTIVFALAYLAWYPGLGAFAGAGGWSSQGQLEAESAQAEAALAQRFAGVGTMPLDAIAADERARTTGQRIFVHNCAMCHGSDARGGKGFPDLTDDAWQWGGTQDDVLASVLDGRTAAMPPLEKVVGSDTQITATAAYVRSLSDPTVSQALAKPGKATFDGLCAGCHGAQGRGNPALGAPDLVDEYWLYGGAYPDIEAAIRLGHDGQMPAHRALLGPTRSRLAAAYVWSLSLPPEAPGAN